MDCFRHFLFVTALYLPRRPLCCSSSWVLRDLPTPAAAHLGVLFLCPLGSWPHGLSLSELALHGVNTASQI